jgi:hypothetical protein
MAEQDFKYDVAFSCLAQDEPVARAINDLLAIRLSTFLYSEQQKEIVAKDGIDVFSRVFTCEARIVVVLYRKGWGDTKWTRVEETAIKGRVLDDGLDFVFLSPLEKPPVVPIWFPKTRLWFDVSQWGPKGAAAAIEERVKESGGAPHEETPEEIVKKLRDERVAEHERLTVLVINFVAWAEEEVQALYRRLEDIAAASGGELRAEDGGRRGLHGDYYTLGVGWHRSHIVNRPEESVLGIILWDGDPFSVGAPVKQPRDIRRRKFRFDITVAHERIWREEGSGRTYTTEGLALECAKMLTDQMRKRR